LPSVTYPSHATMLTGTLPPAHGIKTNLAGSSNPDVPPAWAGSKRVQTRTLFDACRSAGLKSAAIAGDQKMWSILNLGVADHSWPDRGEVPAGAVTDQFGYIANTETHRQVLNSVSNRFNSFVFGHYNETDTVAHISGPHAPETARCYIKTDRLVGEVIDVLAPDWDRTVLIVLSDHGMELLPIEPHVNLAEIAAVNLVIGDSIPENGFSLGLLREGAKMTDVDAAFETVPAVAKWELLEPGIIGIWARNGSIFGFQPPHKAIRASHGGPLTMKTMAVVGGGHPAVPAIASSIVARPPHLADWAPTISRTLRLAMDGLDGQSLGV
jgi:arylsulfatase A-like enzyme